MDINKLFKKIKGKPYSINIISNILEEIDISSFRSGLIFLIITEADQLLEIKKILIKN